MPGGGGPGGAAGGRGGSAGGMARGGVASAERVGGTPSAMPVSPESLAGNRGIQPTGLASEQATASAALADHLLTNVGFKGGMDAIAHANPNGLAKPGMQEASDSGQARMTDAGQEETAQSGGEESGGGETASETPATRQPQESQPSDIDEKIKKTEAELRMLLDIKERIKAQQAGLGGSQLQTPSSRRLAA